MAASLPAGNCIWAACMWCGLPIYRTPPDTRWNGIASDDYCQECPSRKHQPEW